MSSSISTESFGAESAGSRAEPSQPRTESAGFLGVAPAVVDRGAEVELLEAALSCGAHVLLEGPPGTGKSTLLRSVASDFAVPYVLVEGNAELTPTRLLGQFDPALVLTRGYVPEIFADGPLLAAMRAGALLYIEELNRVPEETVNVLLSAMSERHIVVPRLGRVVAAEGFAFVAAMNPFDAVGTARVSAALYDRTCRIVMGYQSEASEGRIVALHQDDLPERWRERAVRLVRATRDHPDIEVGSSVRGAIDFARIAVALAGRRGLPVEDPSVGLAAANVALSGRIRLHDGCTRPAEEIIAELYGQIFASAESAEDTDSSQGEGSPGEP